MRGKSVLPEKPFDIFSLLPEELFLHTVSFLDVPSLLRVITLNHRCCLLCQSDDAGWKRHCKLLWKSKCFAPSYPSNITRFQAYKASIEDAETRQHITVDELCFDDESETGTIWSFRFKESAGPDWTSWDPWWQGKPARNMVFLKNGTVRSYIPPDADLTDDWLLRDPPFSRELRNGGRLHHPPVEMRWRFSETPLDLPQRPRGSYLRFTVGGRDVPTYVVRRSPTGNWGFVAESCWGVYTSFVMPLRHGRHHHSHPRRRSDNTIVFVSEDNEQDDSVLADDENFIITNEVQWREALLYNFGATILPEGDTATQDFERIFGRGTVGGGRRTRESDNGDGDGVTGARARQDDVLGPS